MSRIDLGDNIKKPKTVPATVEGFYQRVDDAQTVRISAELADTLEQHLRGELSKEEYRTKKNELKTGARYYTPHAHFLEEEPVALLSSPHLGGTEGGSTLAACNSSLNISSSSR